jgi:hypothetical protein
MLTFPGATPGPGAVQALSGLRRAGVVRIIDTLLVTKAADGTVTTTSWTTCLSSLAWYSQMSCT